MSAMPDLAFDLPATSVATEPAEERGIARDGVRMLVAGPDGLSHRHVRDLAAVLQAGDVVVLNDSRTLPAHLPGRTHDGEPVAVHLSTPVPGSGSSPGQALAATGSEWIVELRRPSAIGSAPSYQDRTGVTVTLPRGGLVRVHGPRTPDGPARLWRASVSTPRALEAYMSAVGEPIRYDYVARPWPLEAYRTVFGTVSGSAEMPSAGRPVTWRVLRGLAAAGIQVERLTLHCGVSSLESGEAPYPEWFSVPPATAATVNAAHRDGRRVIAVGTTVVRALESAFDGTVQPRRGWTERVIEAGERTAAVDGILTGWHEPQASHLAMLQAVAGADLLTSSYAAALQHGYLWHEFGDVNLLLP